MAWSARFFRVAAVFLLVSSALLVVCLHSHLGSMRGAGAFEVSGADASFVQEFLHRNAEPRALALIQNKRQTGKTAGTLPEVPSVIDSRKSIQDVVKPAIEAVSPRVNGHAPLSAVAISPPVDPQQPVFAETTANPQVVFVNTQGPWWSRIAIQVIFGVLYYFAVVVKYPAMEPGFEPNDEARKLQEMNEISATCNAGFQNNCLSFCCSAPRAAHTLFTTGILNYWAGLLAMTFFPCCTLWFANSFSDLNKQLGGKRKDCCSSCICAFCCSCCVIAQDAESLDVAMNCKTEFCGVAKKEEA